MKHQVTELILTQSEGRGQTTHPERGQVHEASPHNPTTGIEDGSQGHHHCQEVVILNKSLAKALPHGIDVSNTNGIEEIDQPKHIEGFLLDDLQGLQICLER